MQNGLLYWYIVLLIYNIHTVLYGIADNFFVYKPLNQANMQQASRELTAQEAATMKRFLEERIEIAKQFVAIDPSSKELATLEELVKDFGFGRYDLVIQGLYKLGYNSKKVLGITGLRTAMLSGNLEHTPWFLREIAGLDWFFERDSKRSRKYKQWPQLGDKIGYILSLADQLEQNYQRVLDKNMIQDALDILIAKIHILMPKLSGPLVTKVQEILHNLQTVRKTWA